MCFFLDLLLHLLMFITWASKSVVIILSTMEMLYFHLFRRNEIETYNDLSASAAAAQTRMAKDMVAKRIMMAEGA